MVRTYRVTVNGKTYDVNVEELGGDVAPVNTAPKVSTTTTVTQPTPATETVTSDTTPATGGIEAPMPGKVLKIHVTPGTKVEKGTLLLILEAMKMENEIYAPEAGTVKEVACKEGDSVNTGDTLIIIE